MSYNQVIILKGNKERVEIRMPKSIIEKLDKYKGDE